MDDTAGFGIVGLKSHKLKRLLAFVIDAVIVLLLLYIAYRLTGTPDYATVKVSMDRLNAIQGTPEAQAAANEMFALFGRAYGYTLLIWFSYEVISSLILRGSTPGKRICRLRVIARKREGWSWACVPRVILRSVVKVAFLYFLQGIPFLVSCLSIFANPEYRAGIDFFAGTKVIER
ncbi:MAG: RDD family protein [Oscillospiraceae bacterium]|nr:RDD family protein [Oscillospiraceae bacterium]